MTVAQHLLPDPIGKVHWDHIYKNLSNTASLRLSDVSRPYRRQRITEQFTKKFGTSRHYGRPCNIRISVPHLLIFNR